MLRSQAGEIISDGENKNDKLLLLENINPLINPSVHFLNAFPGYVRLIEVELFINM